LHLDKVVNELRSRGTCIQFLTLWCLKGCHKLYSFWFFALISLVLVQFGWNKNFKQKIHLPLFLMILQKIWRSIHKYVFLCKFVIRCTFSTNILTILGLHLLFLGGLDTETSSKSFSYAQLHVHAPFAQVLSGNSKNVSRSRHLLKHYFYLWMDLNFFLQNHQRHRSISVWIW
jgi:hypothetical protein